MRAYCASRRKRPSPGPNRSRERVSSGIVDSVPVTAKFSVHLNVIFETTPKSPRFGAIAGNRGSSCGMSWTVPVPSMMRNA
jgi:hypothetical protein